MCVRLRNKGYFLTLKHSTHIFNLCNTRGRGLERFWEQSHTFCGQRLPRERFTIRETSILRTSHTFCGQRETIMCSWKLESADLLLRLWVETVFCWKQRADYLDEKAADLEMYSMQICYHTTHSQPQTAAICHKLWLLLATLHTATCDLI